MVKKIVKDILSGDSAKAELKITNAQLSETKKIVSVKDSIINKLQDKNSSTEQILTLEREKYSIIDNQLKSTQKELKKEKLKTKIFKTLTSFGAITIGVLLITN